MPGPSQQELKRRTSESQAEQNDLELPTLTLVLRKKQLRGRIAIDQTERRTSFSQAKGGSNSGGAGIG